MDIRKFVQTQEAALKKYRRAYKLLDFLTILTLFYTLMVVLSIDQALPIIRSFEVRAGTAYDVASLSIAFETVVLLTVSVLVSLVLTFILHRKDKKISTIELVEEKYPRLRERLRTAYDNISLDNIIANDLKQTVSSTVESVRSSIFLRKKRINLGLIAIIISVLLLTFVTLNDIHADMTPDDWKDLIDRLPFVPDNSNGNDLFEIDDNSQQPGAEDITGPSAVIIVEGTEIDLSMPPGSAAGLDQDEGGGQDNDFTPSPTATGNSTLSSAYYESLPKGYEAVIKSYFEKMAEK